MKRGDNVHRKKNEANKTKKKKRKGRDVVESRG